VTVEAVFQNPFESALLPMKEAISRLSNGWMQSGMDCRHYVITFQIKLKMRLGAQELHGEVRFRHHWHAVTLSHDAVVPELATQLGGAALVVET
jgi:hypothetical protein